MRCRHIKPCVVTGQRDDDDDDDDEVRGELTQLTEKLKDNETTCGAVTSQLQVAEAAVRDGTKHVSY